MTRKSWLKSWRQFIRQSLMHRSPSRSRDVRRQSKFAAEIQILETRNLLSGAPLTVVTGYPAVSKDPSVAHPEFQRVQTLDVKGDVTPYGTTTPSGITPAQMRKAYGMSSIMFGSITGDGSGQTIAIVDAYNAPTIKSDLIAFNSYFGLPNPPSFKVLNQYGGNNLPGTDPAGPGGWAVEISLDVEWAHVMAPKANLVLFEANSATYTDLLAAVDTARSYTGVSAVSMSFGGGEFYGITSYDYHFTTPTGHQGVTFVASTGDNGAPGGYPAYSPKVVAVGGTTLNIDSTGTYLGETGWSGSGGGYSYYEPEPAYQKSVQNTGYRSIPDVSMNADPYSGVPVYDSYDFGVSTPWDVIGGTSLSAPMFAGVMAVVDQGRVASGGTTLDGSTQTLPFLYKLASTDFHDIISGYNGYSAGKGYDLVTGIGSPIANKFVPDLANGVTVVVTPPALSGIATSTLAYVTTGPALAIAPSLVVTDLSSTTLTGALVQFTAGYATNNDWLTFTSTPNITANYFNATGRLVLSGTASLAEYQTLLRSVKFSFTGRLPSTATRQVSIQVNDTSTPNAYNSNILTRSITVR